MAPEIYDVFLSFRSDVRKTIAKPLSLALKRANFRTFLDESGIATGEIIDSKIPDGIKHSVSAIIIFSTNYATSRWCLDELLLILERMKTSYFPLIPIYCHGVRSGDVKLQEGSIYQEALEKHKKKYGEEKVKMWREALMEVGRCKGVHVDGRLDEFFKKVVEDVKVKITPIFLKMTPDPKWRLHKLFQKILQDVKEKKREGVKVTNPIERLGNGVSLRSHQCVPTSIQGKEESISDTSRIVEVGKTSHVDRVTFVEPVRNEIHQSSTVPEEINEITSHPKWRLRKLFQKTLQDVKEKKRQSMKLKVTQAQTDRPLIDNDHALSLIQQANFQNVDLAPNHIEHLGKGVSLHSHQCLPTSILRKEESISDPSRIIEVGESHDRETFVEPVRNEIHQSPTVPEEINEISYEHEQFGEFINSPDPCTKDELPGNNCWACGLGQLCVILLVAHKNFVESLIRKLQGV